ncbi:MAG: stage 0 sporulation protein, partial [Lachnospiraceae bacterium]|nr:stage 0 sporulation protein [Lachnospiraceae bacterium]
ELCIRDRSDFTPVSIKMAKEQNLSLNPAKISGVCGRLMCCLKNEQETYEYLNDRLPNVGDFVKTVDGFKGEVNSVSVLRQKVKIIVELENGDREIREYKTDELKFKPKRRRNDEKVDKELKELEALERKEGGSKID